MTASAIGVEVKEYPIIFSGEMVNAIREGRKTITRRVVKVPKWLQRMSPSLDDAIPGKAMGVTPCLFVSCADGGQQRLRNPWHWPEPARLWVKETFGIPDAPYEKKVRELVAYKADQLLALQEANKHFWRNVRFMPRWASRITLEITSVRVERLQQISEADAIAEGVCDVGAGCATEVLGPHTALFKDGWNHLNAKRGYSWESNPWVWVIEFVKL